MRQYLTANARSVALVTYAHDMERQAHMDFKLELIEDPDGNRWALQQLPVR